MEFNFKGGEIVQNYKERYQAERIEDPVAMDQMRGKNPVGWEKAMAERRYVLRGDFRGVEAVIVEGVETPVRAIGVFMNGEPKPDRTILVPNHLSQR